MSSENPKENQAQAPAEDEGVSDEVEAADAREGDAAEPEGAEEQDLQAQLDQAAEEVERYRDMALRAEAEMQNVRRRAERDVENAHKYGLEKFLQSLLPVVDSLEKAIEAAETAAGEREDKDDAILEGVRLCHKMLLDVMAKQNVEVIDPEGEPFDPNEHEAVSMVEDTGLEPNSVVTVIQKGYKLNGRLVRPAMVMVSKSPAGDRADASGGGGETP